MATRKRKADQSDAGRRKKQKVERAPEPKVSDIEFVKCGNILTCGTGEVGQLGLKEKREVKRPFGALKDVNIVQAVGRFQHCIAVLEESGKTVVYAWGNNDNGVLGLPTGPNLHEDDEATPRKIADLEGKDIRQVSLGMYHNSALDGQGNLYLWGNYKKDDFLGLRHDKHKNEYVTPQLYPFLNVKCKQVCSGGNFTIVLTEAGDLYEMGWTGTVSRATRERKSSLDPRKLIGCPKMKRILGCGAICAFAESESGEVYAWGFNHEGELGVGNTHHHERPTRIKGLSNVKQLTCGDYHCLALTNDGHVFAWGQGRNGQTGVYGPEYKKLNEARKKVEDKGKKETKSAEGEPAVEIEVPDFPFYLDTPTKIDFFDDKKVKLIGCGDSNSMAILENGELYVWGAVNGLYPDGDYDVLKTPTLADDISRILTKHNVTSASGGSTHALFVSVPADRTDVYGAFKYATASTSSATEGQKELETTDKKENEKDQMEVDVTEKPTKTTRRKK